MDIIVNQCEGSIDSVQGFDHALSYGEVSIRETAQGEVAELYNETPFVDK